MIHSKEKGQALVEFAIILPVLLLIVTGIIEFGFMFNSYLSIQHATREGARIGSVGSTDTEIETSVTNLLNHLDTNNITVTITPGYTSRKRGEAITVNILYDYKTLIPLIGSIVNNIVTLEAETIMRVE